LGVNQLLAEGFPVTIFASLLDNNFLVAVVQLVYDVLDLLIELQLVEFSDAVGRNGGSVQISLSASCFCQVCCYDGGLRRLEARGKTVVLTLIETVFVVPVSKCIDLQYSSFEVTYHGDDELVRRGESIDDEPFGISSAMR
jgi:hypothetical protein